MKTQEAPQLTPLQKVAVGRKLLEAEIVSRAWADDAFRETLETDPVSALTAAGLPLPEGKTIRVIAETPGTLMLVIPPNPVQANEASDEELEAVAGGGLIECGRCTSYEKNGGRNRQESRSDTTIRVICLTFMAPIGFSWGWG